MLTLESPLSLPSGRTIFRDAHDAGLYYYLPNDRARVSDDGQGLSFVVYTEDISTQPDFEVGDDRAGGFLTLEVELGPSPDEIEAMRGELAGLVSGDTRLAQVPFTDGSVTLYVLSRSGAASEAGHTGFEVSVAGSTKPSLFGRQTAVFSVRLGGKAANILWETLRRSADPQAVVTYDFEFLALQPAYNLEVTIDFKQSFDYMRHRIGVNALAAAVDIDLMTQELINDGHITVRETDYTGQGNASSPIAGEGGILKLVRDLMSPTLFTTVPIPTPEYRALPDSASQALSTGGGTRSFLGSADPTPRSPLTAGSDLKLTHTPIGAGQTPGAEIELAVTVEPAAGVSVGDVKLLWRRSGTTPYSELPMTRGTGTATGGTVQNPGGSAGGAVGLPPTGGSAGGAPPAPAPASPAPAPGPAVGQTPVPSPAPAPAPAPAAPVPAPPAPVPAPPAPVPAPPAPVPAPPAPVPAPPAPGPTPAPNPAPPPATNAYRAKLPGQPSGTTIEYLIRATGTKAGAAVTQTLPEAGEREPLKFTAGAAPVTGGGGTQARVPLTDGPLLGYSLQSIDISQQVKRSFLLNKSQAVTQRYHPSGALSANDIGPAFDPQQQITRVALGEGPFRVIVLRLNAGFDFARHDVLAATVRVEYGRQADGSPLQALSATLTQAQPSAQLQFFADEAGTQHYRYWVEFSHDPDQVVGLTPGQVVASPVFEGVTARSITVDLDTHLPLIPVEVLPGVLSLDPTAPGGLIRQVQVRIAPAPAGEGRVVMLSHGSVGARVMVMPALAGVRSYHATETFFFRDGVTTIERPDLRDTQVVVNEPADLVFKMIPTFADPTGLVKEVLVDAVYRHVDGSEQRATLHLDATRPRSEFAVLLAPNDPREWNASFRFLMTAGEPLEGRVQRVQVSEPLVHLGHAGFRVVSLALEDELAFSTNAALLGIKVTLGADVDDENVPSISTMLRPSRPATALVVPGVPIDGPVSVAIELLRRGQPPERLRGRLSPFEKELYIRT